MPAKAVAPCFVLDGADRASAALEPTVLSPERTAVAETPAEAWPAYLEQLQEAGSGKDYAAFGHLVSDPLTTRGEMDGDPEILYAGTDRHVVFEHYLTAPSGRDIDKTELWDLTSFEVRQHDDPSTGSVRVGDLEMRFVEGHWEGHSMYLGSETYGVIDKQLGR